MSDGNSTQDAAEIGEGVRVQAYEELQQHAFDELQKDWQGNTDNA